MQKNTIQKDYQKFNRQIFFRQLLDQKDHILIAVSGGQDSMYLLHVLIMLKKKWKLRLSIIHCNHRWFAHSTEQALLVYNISKKLNISLYHTLSINIIKTEEYGRKWRYNIFQYIAIYHNYSVIATAHSATDRVETFFYNLFRGSGINGLQALNWKKKITISIPILYRKLFMHSNSILYLYFLINENNHIIDFYKKNITLIRPLLSYTRNEISKNLQIKLPLYFDKSNSNISLYRNKIRKRLIPYLRLFFNNQIDKNISKLSEVLYSENEYLNSITHSLFYKLRINIKYKNKIKEYRCINLTSFFHIPIALQRRLLDMYLKKYSNTKRNFDTIELLRLWCVNSVTLFKYNKIFIKNDIEYSKRNIILNKNLQFRIINKTILCLYN